MNFALKNHNEYKQQELEQKKKGDNLENSSKTSDSNMSFDENISDYDDKWKIQLDKFLNKDKYKGLTKKINRDLEAIDIDEEAKKIHEKIYKEKF